MKVKGDDLRKFLVDHGFDAEEVHDLNLPTAKTSHLSFEPSDKVSIRWRPGLEAWLVEVKYPEQRGHKVKVYCPIGYTSPLVLAAFDHIGFGVTA